MGNVLIDWNTDKISKKINEKESQFIQRYLFQSPTWFKLDEGTISIEDGLKEILKQAPIDKQSIIEYAYYHWFNYIDLLEDMKNLIITLKRKGYSIYLLSNCSKMFYYYYKQKDVFQYFDGYYVSADTKLLKPNPSIYQDFLSRFNLNANECIFIDDIKENTDSAKRIGMESFQYTKNITELKQYLHTKTMIYIKPHHFIDIIKLYGLGIEHFIPDNQFHHDFYRVGNIIINDLEQLLSLTVDGDDICFPCLKYKNNVCNDFIEKTSKNDYNRNIDIQLLSILHLKTSVLYSVNDLLHIIYEHKEVIYDVWKNEDNKKTDKRYIGFIQGYQKLMSKQKKGD